MLRILLLLVGLALIAFLALWLVALGGAAVATVAGVKRIRARLAARKFERMRRAVPADPLEQAWTQVAGEADWAVSRIAAARTSCSRLLAIADGDPLAADAVDWANVVRRRVPDLVAACRAECADATPSERRRNLEDLVESLEKIGAEADRRRDRYRGVQVTPFQVQRTYVDQRTRPDSLS
jgi:hypothetical protein